MSREEILAKIRDIVVEELGVSAEKVTEEARFIEDLGADSIGVMELVMKMEEAFDVQIPDQDIEKIRTVKDAIDYILSKKGQ
ncbi:MAG: acyl carrier protein [Candidatus Caldipriscus sp.]|jgi:acyl carrier protein|nr:acyl carrier protein [Candidatus Caldipriscus sp.]